MLYFNTYISFTMSFLSFGEKRTVAQWFTLHIFSRIVTTNCSCFKFQLVCILNYFPEPLSTCEYFLLQWNLINISENPMHVLQTGTKPHMCERNCLGIHIFLQNSVMLSHPYKGSTSEIKVSYSSGSCTSHHKM